MKEGRRRKNERNGFAADGSLNDFPTSKKKKKNFLLSFFPSSFRNLFGVLASKSTLPGLHVNILSGCSWGLLGLLAFMSDHEAMDLRDRCVRTFFVGKKKKKRDKPKTKNP